MFKAEAPVLLLKEQAPFPLVHSAWSFVQPGNGLQLLAISLEIASKGHFRPPKHKLNHNNKKEP